jgi:hypothetical protein
MSVSSSTSNAPAFQNNPEFARQLLITFAENETKNNNFDSVKDHKTFVSFFGAPLVSDFINKKLKDAIKSLTFTDVYTLFSSSPSETAAKSNFDKAFSTALFRKLGNNNTTVGDNLQNIRGFMVSTAQPTFGKSWYENNISKLVPSDFLSNFKVSWNQPDPVEGVPQNWTVKENVQPDTTDPNYPVNNLIWNAAAFYSLPSLSDLSSAVISNAIRINNGNSILVPSDVPAGFFSVSDANNIVLGDINGSNHNSSTLASHLGLVGKFTTILGDLDTSGVPKAVVVKQTDSRVVGELKKLPIDNAWQYYSLGTDSISKVVAGVTYTYSPLVNNIIKFANFRSLSFANLVSIYRNSTAQNTVNGSVVFAGPSTTIGGITYFGLLDTTPNNKKVSLFPGGDNNSLFDVMAAVQDYLGPATADPTTLKTSGDIATYLKSDILNGPINTLLQSATTVSNTDASGTTGYNSGNGGTLKKLILGQPAIELDNLYDAMKQVASDAAASKGSTLTPDDILRKTFNQLEQALDLSDIPSISPVPTNGNAFFGVPNINEATTVDHIKRLLLLYVIQIGGKPMDNIANHKFLNLVIKAGTPTTVSNGVIVQQPQGLFGIKVNTPGSNLSAVPQLTLVDATSGKILNSIASSDPSVYTAFSNSLGVDPATNLNTKIATYITQIQGGNVNNSDKLKVLTTVFGGVVIVNLTSNPTNKSGNPTIIDPPGAGNSTFSTPVTSANPTQLSVLKTINGGDLGVENLKLFSKLVNLHNDTTSTGAARIAELFNADQNKTGNFLKSHTYLNTNAGLQNIFKNIMTNGDYDTANKFLSTSNVKGSDGMTALKNHIRDDTTLDTDNAANATDVTSTEKVTISKSTLIFKLASVLNIILQKDLYVDPVSNTPTTRLVIKDYVNSLFSGKQYNFVAVAAKANADGGDSVKRLTKDGFDDLVSAGISTDDIDGSVFAVPVQSGFEVLPQLKFFAYVGKDSDGNRLFDSISK